MKEVLRHMITKLSLAIVISIIDIDAGKQPAVDQSDRVI